MGMIAKKNNSLEQYLCLFTSVYVLFVERFFDQPYFDAQGFIVQKESVWMRIEKKVGLMKNTRFVLSGFFVAVIIATSSPALAVSLGAAEGYNAFVFGDFESTSDCEGRLAVGGNASLDGYSVGEAVDSGTIDTLVVGGNLEVSSGTVYGNVSVAGTAPVSNNSFTVSGTINQNADIPIDFTTAQTYLTNLSATLETLTANGQTSSQGNALSLTGDGTSDLVVFDIDGSLLSSISTYSISGICDGATVIINVSGTDISMSNAGMDSFESLSSNVLFNFYEADSLTLSSIGFYGSILAPNAAITANNGQLNGTVIADSWSGSMELHNVPFSSTATVPVPGTGLLLSIGLISLVGIRQRRNS